MHMIRFLLKDGPVHPIQDEMQLLFILLFQFLSLFCWAYTYEVEAGVINPSPLRYKALKQSFQRAGLASLSDQAFVSSSLKFDFAFASSEWKKFVLIKEGLKAPASDRYKIFHAKDLSSLVVNFEFQGSHYVLIATGLTAAELKNLFQDIAPLKENAQLWKLRAFFPTAQAAQCASPALTSTQKLAPTLRHIENVELLRTIGKCSGDALRGAYQGAENTLSFFKVLAQNPAKLWQEMKQSFDELKAFTMNMQTEIKKILANMQTLSVEQRLELACTITGELLLGTATSLAVGGSQLAKLLPQLLLKLKNSTQHLTLLAELQKKGFTIPDINVSTRKILSCVQ